MTYRSIDFLDLWKIRETFSVYLSRNMKCPGQC